MPLVEVSIGPSVTDRHVEALAAVLPHAVSLAVECPEEPYDLNLQPGDVEVRFRTRGAYDVSGLDIVVEVRSKWFASRAENREARCDELCRAISQAVEPCSVGVYLTLPIAAWSQST